MEIALVTGSAGLIGSETVRFLAKQGLKVVGVDNNMRERFFGGEGSTVWNRNNLLAEVPGYVHYDLDIRDTPQLEKIFSEYGSALKLIVHAAAQPSHDWAAKDPGTDFTINANGTLNLLELTRNHCSRAVFIFVSTNKVYGDLANSLPLVELETRWEIDPSHPFHEHGIDESMSIDQSMHSLFGVSKAAADLLVQEYGRYFGIKTACFRGGCLTGPNHSGTLLHGFLAYLIKCGITGEHYTVLGYKGKQVRDNIHSYDLVNMFWHFYRAPRVGEVYNAGGGRHANCSIVEAIRLCEEITGRKMNWSYTENNRIGDHVWWVSDIRKFRSHYPAWDYKYSLREIFEEILKGLLNREEELASGN